MKDFYWWNNLGYPENQIVTQEMHSESLWHAVHMTLKQQRKLYGFTDAIGDEDKRAQVRTRCLMIARMCMEFVGTLRCQGTLQCDELAAVCSKLVKEMESDFEKNHTLTYFKHL